MSMLSPVIFPGLESRLDYIQECNVNYLHLMPLLETPKGRSDGGYAVSDFRMIRKDLGTMDDCTSAFANAINVVSVSALILS